MMRAEHLGHVTGRIECTALALSSHRGALPCLIASSLHLKWINGSSFTTVVLLARGNGAPVRLGRLELCNAYEALRDSHADKGPKIGYHFRRPQKRRRSQSTRTMARRTRAHRTDRMTSRVLMV